MSKLLFALLSLVVLLTVPSVLPARDIPAVVSVNWLEEKLTNPAVKVLDIRKPEDFKAGHVPGAINVYYGTWAVKTFDFDNELPPDDDLTDIINDIGLSYADKVVIVGNTDPVGELAGATRVAWTLEYAGFENVAVLDGGFGKWQGDNKPVSNQPVPAKGESQELKFKKTLRANEEYLLQNREKSIILDTRLPDVFFGITKPENVERAGRIKGALNLPSAWMFTKHGTYKPVDDLRAIAEGVIGKDTGKEIIIYCDTGKLASTWWFVLSEMLGYKNVRMYDGSFQEFSQDPNLPMEKYSWR
jgi:thiosulfate/3-mercaptopyruvate sulfurtransferase